MTVYSENGVPILADVGGAYGLSPESAKRVADAHRAYMKAIDDAGTDLKKLTAAKDEHYLIAETVLLGNSDPARGDTTLVSPGASDLQEALTEIIGVYDQKHTGADEHASSDVEFPPRWVASTSDELAELIAEYYRCPRIDVSEAL